MNKEKIIESALEKMKQNKMTSEASKWYNAGFLDGIEFTINNLCPEEKTIENENLSKKKYGPDYEGFCTYVKKRGSPVGYEDLKRLAKRYNCPVPRVVDGKIVFDE